MQQEAETASPVFSDASFFSGNTAILELNQNKMAAGRFLCDDAHDVPFCLISILLNCYSYSLRCTALESRGYSHVKVLFQKDWMDPSTTTARCGWGWSLTRHSMDVKWVFFKIKTISGPSVAGDISILLDL